MWASSSSHGRKSVAPGRVSKGSSVGKAPTSRLPSVDRLSSGAYSNTSNRFSLLGGTSLSKFSSSRLSHGLDRDRGRTELRDPRPLNSRAYQQRCIKALLDFLECYGYPNSISAKALTSPTSKDFLNMFVFIVKHIEYKYKLPDKYDEEIPRYFRSLGYPFTINKSSMFTIGSPHTWPNLLSALVWLTELVKAGLSLNQETDDIIFHQEEDFDNSSDSLLIYKYLDESYKLYMSGSELESLDEILHITFKEKLAVSNSEVEKVEQENVILRKKLQECECVEDDLERMRENKAIQEQDIGRMTNYMAELYTCKEKLDKNIEKETKEAELLDVEYGSLEAQLKSLQVIFDNQECSPGDAERMKFEESQLHSQLETLEGEEAEIDQDIWNKELEIGKLQEKLNNNAQQYNTLARKLKLIPSTAENAGGLDFEMKPGSLFDTTPEQIQNLKMQILSVKEKITEALHAAKAEQRYYEDIIVQETDQYNEKAGDVTALKSRLNRLEEAYNSEKILHKQWMETTQAMYDKDYEERNEIKKSLEICSQELEFLNMELKEVEEQSAKEAVLRAAKDKNSIEFLQRVTNRVAEHKSRLKNQLLSVHTLIATHKEKSLATIYSPKH